MNSFHTDSRQRLQFTVWFEIDLDLNKLCTSLTRLHSKKKLLVLKAIRLLHVNARDIFIYNKVIFLSFFSSKTEATKGLNVASWKKIDNFWKIKRYTLNCLDILYFILWRRSQKIVCYFCKGKRCGLWASCFFFFFFSKRDFFQKRRYLSLLM